MIFPTREFTTDQSPSGIAGGFVPADPTVVKSVSYAAETNTLQIVSSLSDPGPAIVDKHHTVDGLVEELHSILKTIPTEDPKGSEDIYGLNIGIAWGYGDFLWQNVGPAGCGGTSIVQATEEDKKKFKRALEIADELVALKGTGS